MPSVTKNQKILKKVGNDHSKLLAYRSYSCIQAMQNGEADLAQFPIAQKNVEPPLQTAEKSEPRVKRVVCTRPSRP